MTVFPSPIHQTEVIGFGEIDTHPPYQREYNEMWVEFLSGIFNPNLVQRPKLSLREGRLWCIDGQHTIGILKNRGYTAAECDVYIGLSYEAEAQYHADFNRYRKVISHVDLFKSLLEAKDPQAIGINEVITKHEFTIAASSKSGHIVRSIRSLWIAWENCDGDAPRIFEGTFTLLEPWRRLPYGIAGPVLVGIIYFLRDVEGPFDFVRFGNRLSTINPRMIEGEVNDLRSFGSGGVSSHARPELVKRVLLSHYNKRLSPTKRVALKEPKK